MKIVTLPLFFLVYAKKSKSPDQSSTATSDDFTEMTNQELITDASGKLRKLGARAAGIYVEYLGDWSRADNYRHKHDKMQTVLMQYLKKCGYQKGQVSQLKDDWEVPKRTTKSKDKKNKKDRKRRAPDEIELPTLQKHLNSMANLWADFENDFEDDEVNPSDLINQRGIGDDLDYILNDERNNERDQEIAAAYTKIRKLFNGYGIFSKMYLKECKKFSKIEKRLSKTNERLVGAIGKFQQWQIQEAERQEREERKAAIEAAKALAAAEEEAAGLPEETKEEKRKRKKAEKKANKAEKATKRPPKPEEDTFFGASV